MFGFPAAGSWIFIVLSVLRSKSGGSGGLDGNIPSLVWVPLPEQGTAFSKDRTTNAFTLQQPSTKATVTNAE